MHLELGSSGPKQHFDYRLKGLFMQSPSLMLGRSFLPGRVSNIRTFVAQAASAIEQNPDVAAEISLAATAQLLAKCDVPVDLRNALTQLVSESCKARDVSTAA